MTSPPAIVRPYIELDVRNKLFFEENEKRYADMSLELDKFSQAGEQSRALLSEAFANNSIMPRHITGLSLLIDAVEKKAEDEACKLASIHKSGERSFKRLASVLGKEDARKLQSLHRRMIELNTRELGEMTDMALFLRALRARHIDQERSAVIFENSRELGVYLENLLA